MSLFNENQVRVRAKQAVTMQRTASIILNESIQRQASISHHDIFLSHSYDDRELVLGVALLIEDMGYTVYIDWRDDPSLDRKNITAQTAEKLRVRMKQSRCLFFSTTEHASESKWMPWELGFKDGHNARTAILPIIQTTTEAYVGQQYLGIYPYVSDGEPEGSQKNILWIHRSPKCYVWFDAWLKGDEPTDHL